MKKYKGYIIKRYPSDYIVFDKDGRFVELGFKCLNDAKKYIDKENELCGKMEKSLSTVQSIVTK